MSPLFKEIEELTRVYHSLLPMKQECQDKLDKKFRLEFNYNSNHMEGNTLTYDETALLLIFDDTLGKHSFREYEEMKAHDVAFQLIKEWAQEKEHPFTESDIKTLNRIILAQPFWKQAVTNDGKETSKRIEIGEYKKHPNSVRLPNGEIFMYPSPLDTPMLMDALMQWYKSELAALHPVTLAAMLHYKFVSIHPFDDGNGRVARLLMNYVLLKNNLPAVIIKSAEKQGYLSALHYADAGNFEDFIEYIGEQLLWSLKTAINAARDVSIDEADDLDKRVNLIDRMLTSKSEAIKQTKNEQILTNVLNEVVIPLFELTYTKCEKLVPLFSRVDLGYFVNSAGQTNLKPKAAIEAITKTWDTNKGNIDGVSLTAKFFKLKKLGKDAFDITDALSISFDEHKYIVAIRSNYKIELLYHQVPSSKDLEKWSNKFVEDIISGIEQRIAHNNKKKEGDK